ncbi:MAG: type II toxin-antitoxin system prevent-host-death family antitoxin [Acidobacteria bacterium]|nr:type II toxin-antitoxin system prevent-host-death family antitoxin [Acidobacteriota bacterium]
MKTVGVRALKNRLSEYLRLVQAGESLAVTKRGVVVARLIPPDVRGETAEQEPHRTALSGETRLGKPDRPGLYPPPPGLLSEDAIQAALDWTRGER